MLSNIMSQVYTLGIDYPLQMSPPLIPSKLHESTPYPPIVFARFIEKNFFN